MRNRFKGLDLIDRVPDELWNEVSETVQETGIKTIPMEKKCKKQVPFSFASVILEFDVNSKRSLSKSCFLTQSLLLMSSSRSSMVSHLIFKSLIYFQLIFA